MRDVFPVVVHGLLIRDGKIFLLRRVNTGVLDGFFSLPGGHQRYGETVQQALCRELLEETGAEVQLQQPLGVLPYQYNGTQGINFIFEILKWRGALTLAEPDFSDECLWAEIDKLPKSTVHWVHHILELRAQGAWFSEIV